MSNQCESREEMRCAFASGHGGDCRFPAPGHAKSGRYIVGADNDLHIKNACRSAWSSDGMVLCAWGKNASEDRLAFLRALIEDVLVEPRNRAIASLMCIKTNEDGSPIHPLYQPYTSKPIPWQWQS